MTRIRYLLLILMLISVYGCGATAATTASVSSGASVSVSSNPSSLSTYGVANITATVKDSSGNSVSDGTSVTFSINDSSMGTLSVTTATTSSGVAKATLTGGISGGSLTISSDPSSVSSSGTSTLTATVKDSSNNLVSGVTVSFSLDSTAASLSSSTAVTNLSGIATVTLTGGTSPATVTATATASTLTGSTTITITQISSTGSITVSASSSTISTSSSTTISATVKDSSNNPVSGATVGFSLSNEAATISPASAATNASGVATSTITSGTTPTSVTVTAAATVSSSTLTGSATITIEAPSPSSLSLASNPPSITVQGTSTITATVKDSNNDPVIDGTSVSFSLSSSTYGSLSNESTTTAGGNGTATTTFTASNSAGTVTITAMAGNVSSTIALTVTPASAGSIQFVSATPQVIGLKGSGQTASSTIKFLVNDINGNPVADGTAVNFTIRGPGGGEYIGEADDTLATATGSTVSGNATVILNSGTVAGPVTVTASTNINSGTTTTISSNTDATTTTISATSTSGFPATGRIRIDNELIDYTGKTGTTFTGCTRGVSSTTAVSHISGAKVYNQDTISSSATQISIGGGVPSNTHWNLSTSKFNLPGFSWSNIEATISVYMADRFGNYNVLTGTATSFYTEGGAIDRQGITDSTGKTSVIIRTQSPSPQDVDRAQTGDAISSAYFNGNNEPYYTSGSVTYNPRDGWVTVLATTSGEEEFADENVNGLFTRSYATTICPYGYICECDGGVTNGDPTTTVNAGSQCPSSEKRSEGFKDLGEPFYDVNDDGTRDDGLTSGKPFELYIDANGNGQYDTPNGMWDGPDCEGSTCERNKTIWKESRLVFSYGTPQFYPLPDANNCYNLISENPACSATFASGSFAVAPVSIAKGASGSFTVIVGDANLNLLEGGTTITATASAGTLIGGTYTVPDALSRGPTRLTFYVDISATETKTSTTVTVTVTNSTRGLISSISVAVPII